MEEKQVIVLGGGPAGYVAAIRASRCGARVLLVEKEDLGGTCLHRGCIPTKSLLRGVEVLGLVQKSRLYGIHTGDVSVDFPKMMAHKDLIVRNLLAGTQTLMKSNNIEVINGTGRLLSRNALEVDHDGKKSVFHSEKIILAPGSSPVVPPIPGAESRCVITTDEVLQLREIPESMAIIGAGASGVEFATIFARLGTKVTLIEMMPHIMPTEDEEIARSLERSLKRMRVKIYTGTRVEQIKDDPEGGKTLLLKTDEREQTVSIQLVLAATGRKPNIEELGLRSAGVHLLGGAIEVNNKMETSVSGIYAAGDAVGGIMLAHVASTQGKIAAENALGNNSSMDGLTVPRCVYTMPEVGAVGLTEKQALDKGHEIKIGRFSLTANGKAMILGEREGLIKIIADEDSGEILGINMVSPQATELIAAATLAVQTRVPLKEFASFIHAHPTLHESIQEAGLDVDGEAIHIPPRK